MTRRSAAEVAKAGSPTNPAATGLVPAGAGGS